MQKEERAVLEQDLKNYISDYNISDSEAHRVKNTWWAAVKAKKNYSDFCRKRMENRPYAHP